MDSRLQKEYDRVWAEQKQIPVWASMLGASVILFGGGYLVKKAAKKLGLIKEPVIVPRKKMKPVVNYNSICENERAEEEIMDSIKRGAALEEGE